ncbi:hypothetical protein OG533_39435 (plasmid) [Streptomyces sp. NBC_01186]|uniref:deazapurine DNA modification protein DpdA family protein n=1 Tax=unclassified Streptomyces TaxID=2593676 RepID=UPI002DD82C67|nr:MULTISPECIES: hypothetical protein [unclassified Streptomyces]WSB81984.1 hypothetical protein OHB04_40325 [Streptomyces sp. NBC_01775]WSS17959.1 hypothetical protein OG533_39435 [Streptomyces sp. NBC_01186]
MRHLPPPRFYLGTHQPSWLPHVAHPLFVSYSRIRNRRRLDRIRALGPWALDSGAFSQLDRHGEWTIPAAEYAASITRYHHEIGGLEWAAPQDWPCEPPVTAKTGLTVEEHQRRTVDSVLQLRALVPAVRVIPVLQGWTLASYMRCAQMYADAGVDLAAEPLVGVGSMCRRQSSITATVMLDQLVNLNGPEAPPLRLHAFGFKLRGLTLATGTLTSADSMAWSYAGRNEPGCGPSHQSEANCLPYALRWGQDLIDQLADAHATRR